MKLGHWSDYFVIITKELIAGILLGAGFGGFITIGFVQDNQPVKLIPYVLVIGFVLVATGSLLARHAQKSKRDLIKTHKPNSDA